MFLSEIVRNFDSQLSQEQTWAVCYMAAKYFSAQRRENMLKRRSVIFRIDIENVELTADGNVAATMQEDAARRQTESELIQKVGQLLCRCLDSGLDDVSLINSENFESELAELITGMVLQQFSENDEGYEDDFADEVSTRKIGHATRSFRSFDEICRFCEARLKRKKIVTGMEHYRNVVKALYREAFELKMFLDHVNSSLMLASDCQEVPNLKPSVASTAQECVYEWARLWLQVMHELRRGVHLKKVAQTKVSPSEYELSPYEMAIDGAMATGIVAKPPKESRLPENASDIIMDFILSRPVDKCHVSPFGHAVEPPQSALNQDETENFELKDILEAADYLEQSGDILEKSDRRKSLKVESPLWSKIQNWDASQESILSDDLGLSNNREVGFWEEDLSAKTIGRLHSDSGDLGSRRNSDDLGHSQGIDKRKRLRRRRSAELSFDNDNNNVAGFSGPKFENLDLNDRRGSLDKSKKRLAVSALCLTEISLDEDPRAVGTSLFEISKIRKAITAAETESLALSSSKSRNIANGKLCFACRKSKFTLFSKPKQCDVCQKNFCSKCISMNVEIPNHLVDVKGNREQQQHDDLHRSRGLSRSLGNLATCIGEDTVTPFPCKRQSMLQIGGKHAFGGKLADICHDCKKFMDSIVTETKNLRWHVGMTMDL